MDIQVSRQLFSYLKYKNLSTFNDSIHNGGIFFFLFLGTREAVAPLANDPIMSSRSKWSFKNIEHQKSSKITDNIDRKRML